MAKYAEIEDGKVVNVVLADTKEAAARGLVEVTGRCDKGWSWDGQKFAAPPPAVTPSVPEPLTADMLARALIKAGRLTQAQIDAARDPESK